jgi:hypothetical protein
VDKQYKDALDAIPDKLLQEFSIFQVKGQEVADFHTLGFKVPPSVFKQLLKRFLELKASGLSVPPMRVFVTVDPSNESQMLGVAKQDFYLVVSERPFWGNFLKGVIGIWCMQILALGVTVACSTHLSAVISLLTTMFLAIAALFSDFLKDVAEGRVEGGGPTQAFIRTITQMPIAGQLEDSPTKTLVLFFDEMFGWVVGRVLNLVPNIAPHYNLHQYVANGFDIGIDVLSLDNFLPLFGYLLPWAILAYYLMKYREIANPS